MTRTSGVSSKKDTQGKGASYYSLLGIIRSVLEKNGGTMKLDEDTNTILLSIPPDKKEPCWLFFVRTIKNFKIFAKKLLPILIISL